MNPLKKIVREIMGDNRTSGRVLGRDNGLLTIMTSKGVIRVDGSNLAYLEGDEVRIVNGTVVGRIRKASSLPVYYV